MKHDSCIYIILPDPIFNKEEIDTFEKFNEKNTICLNFSLMLNHKEIINELQESSNFIICLNVKDRDYLPEEFSDIKQNVICFEDKDFIFRTLSAKYFNNFSNNILTFGKSIGFSKSDIIKILNLLSNEDETLVLGKTENHKLSFIGFNKFNPGIINNELFSNPNYNFHLKKGCSIDNFIYTLENFMLIENKKDFRKLYYELSKKDSFSYCSERIHEMFTNLFIEYKEILN